MTLKSAIDRVATRLLSASIGYSAWIKFVDTEYDHLNLSDSDRELIAQACGNALRVFLEPMDKGLSGSVVWQGRWVLESGRESKLHVFKIGKKEKLIKEEAAISNIASVIDTHFPHAKLYTLPGSDRALLRQEFAGDPAGSTFSLRNFFVRPEHRAKPFEVKEIIDRLYRDRMFNWHFCEGSGGQNRSMAIAEAIPWWVKKIDLLSAAKDIGIKTLEKAIENRFSMTISQMSDEVSRVMDRRMAMRVGPVHGDLHAQNVNLDGNHRIYLIDFGNTVHSWRAMDFFILESALKFAASPPHCPVEQLLQIDYHADKQAGAAFSVESLLFPHQLLALSAAVRVIRQHCIDSQAETVLANYHAGLVCAAAAFTSIEWLVNRVYLFYNIAYQLTLIRKMEEKEA